MWRLFGGSNGRWRLAALLQQMVLRLQTLATWPQALSNSRRFVAALRAARRREQQQQQQQVEEAAAAEELQLAEADVPPLLPVQPPLCRAYLPKMFSVSALCVYGGVVAVLVDLLLGLFLPQLLALLIYRLIPADACSSFSLSPHVQETIPQPPIPPLFPISLSETAVPRLYPAIHELQQQQQQLNLQGETQEQQQQHESEAGRCGGSGDMQQVVRGAAAWAPHGCCREKRQQRRRPLPVRWSLPRSSAATAAAAAAKGSGSASHHSPPWREVMTQPTSAVLADLFSACYCFLHVHLLTSHAHWLMNFPAGLKLNANLTRVLGAVVLSAIRLWNDLTAYLHSAILFAGRSKWQDLWTEAPLCRPETSKPLPAAAGAAGSSSSSSFVLFDAVRDAAVRTAKRIFSVVSLGPTTFPSGNPEEVSLGSSSQHEDSSSSSRGVWGVCEGLVRRVAWVGGACGLCLKVGLGTLLTTFRLGWLGLSASMFVAASADLLMLVTLHIFYVYLVCARLLHVNLKSLHSLFLLFSPRWLLWSRMRLSASLSSKATLRVLLLRFRGRKWNVLRRRVDSADLQVDQLLIGCILFTITVCLFPTTLVFYVSYLLIWLLVFCTQSLLRLALLLLFSFPLCLLVFRVVFPHLFAAGIALEPIHGLASHVACGAPRCCNQPLHAKHAAPAGPAAVAAAGAAKNSSSSSIYFLLRARPIGFSEIILPPVCAAARATLGPLRLASLLPKILSGKIVRLSRCNSAWPPAQPPQHEWEEA
ncbi:hypothetical protein Esti_000823 [Eimeria stiedai]